MAELGPDNSDDKGRDSDSKITNRTESHHDERNHHVRGSRVRHEDKQQQKHKSQGNTNEVDKKSAGEQGREKSIFMNL